MRAGKIEGLAVCTDDQLLLSLNGDFFLFILGFPRSNSIPSADPNCWREGEGFLHRAPPLPQNHGLIGPFAIDKRL